MKKIFDNNLILVILFFITLFSTGEIVKINQTIGGLLSILFFIVWGKILYERVRRAKDSLINLNQTTPLPQSSARIIVKEKLFFLLKNKWILFLGIFNIVSFPLHSLIIFILPVAWLFGMMWGGVSDLQTLRGLMLIGILDLLYIVFFTASLKIFFSKKSIHLFWKDISNSSIRTKCLVMLMPTALVLCVLIVLNYFLGLTITPSDLYIKL